MKRSTYILLLALIATFVYYLLKPNNTVLSAPIILGEITAYTYIA